MALIAKRIGDKISQALREDQLKPADLAQQMGCSKSQVYRYQNGDGLTVDTIAEIGRITGKPLAWFFAENQGNFRAKGQRPPPKGLPRKTPFRPTIAVVGYVAAGKCDVVFTDEGYPPGDGFDFIERPLWLRDPNAFAVRVRGNSMYPPFRERTIVVADTTAQVVNGDMVIVRVASSGAYWKIYRERDGIVTLESANPGHEAMSFRSEEILFKYKVVQILPPRGR